MAVELSVRVTVKLEEAPKTVGVPVIRPAELKDQPVGKVPDQV